MANEEIAFAFEYDNRAVILPITPEDIEITYPGNNTSANIIQLGEITLLKKRKLATFTIKSWFPDDNYYPGIKTSGRFEDSNFYVNFFEKIREDKKPCLFIVYGLNITMYVSIESFVRERRGGEHEDLYYQLSFKEYKSYSIKELPPRVQEESPEILETIDKKTPILEPTEITVGTTVIVNGTIHSDSYGSNPGKSLSNYTGAVNLINKKGTHPYHIVTPAGGWLGWVNKEALSIAPTQISGIPLNARPKQTSKENTTTATSQNTSTGLNLTPVGTSVLQGSLAGLKLATTKDVANSSGAEKTKNMKSLEKQYATVVSDKVKRVTGDVGISGGAYA